MSVSIKKCENYDIENVEKATRELFAHQGFDCELFGGKKVLVKPNLVSAVTPDAAATVHPSVVEACCKIIKELGGIVTIAESPGSLYTVPVLKNLYKTTGIAQAAENSGVALNYDLESEGINYDKGEVSKFFEIIKPVLECDVIFDIAKLKSHTLTLMTANVKNLFGTIPGVFKAEQHARYKNQDVFQKSLIDLACFHCENKKVVCLTDAVIAMEGNGPGGGTPKKIGCLLASNNIFECDVFCAAIINQSPEEVKMLRYASERGLIPKNPLENIEQNGDSYKNFVAKDFVQPDTKLKKWFDVIPKSLSPKPKINKNKCVGCGKCAAVCPQKTVSIIKINDRQIAKINYKKCIHCFCCQELCPIHAIDVHKNLIFKIVK